MDVLSRRLRKAGAVLPLAAVLLVALFLAPRGARALEATATEQEVKAAYLFNFTKFVEWPDGTFASPSGPLQICVFGQDPFGRLLDGVIQGQQVEGKSLAAARPERIADLRSCHVLFVSRSERGRLGEILASVRGSSVLTVGEGEEFLEKGGMIAFVRQGPKVRFHIEKKAAEQAPFKISSRLMALGDRRGNG